MTDDTRHLDGLPEMNMEYIDPKNDQDTVTITFPGDKAGALWEVYIKEEHYAFIQVFERRA